MLGSKDTRPRNVGTSVDSVRVISKYYDRCKKLRSYIIL